MHRFLTNNRADLIERCKAKVAERLRRAATTEQLKNGISLFLEQPIWTLQAEEQLLAALGNLLQNAFRFTRAHTQVTLHAYAAGDRLFIDVKDHCGGLSQGEAQRMFTPFSQRRGDKAGLGMGLSIAKQSLEADEGVLTVRDVPGTGCVVTISLPPHAL